MIIYISLKDDYVTGWGTTRASESDIKIELSKDHDFFNSDFHCWKYIDNELVFDKEKQQQIINEHEARKNKLSTEDMISLAVLELAEQIELLKGEK